MQETPYALVDDAFLPLELAEADGTGSAPATGTALEISGAEVSSVRRVDGMLEVRVFDPSHTATEMHLAGRSGSLIDLRGHVLAAFATDDFH